MSRFGKKKGLFLWSLFCIPMYSTVVVEQISYSSNLINKAFYPKDRVLILEQLEYRPLETADKKFHWLRNHSSKASQDLSGRALICICFCIFWFCFCNISFSIVFLPIKKQAIPQKRWLKQSVKKWAIFILRNFRFSDI